MHSEHDHIRNNTSPVIQHDRRQFWNFLKEIWKNDINLLREKTIYSHSQTVQNTLRLKCGCGKAPVAILIVFKKHENYCKSKRNTGGDNNKLLLYN